MNVAMFGVQTRSLLPEYIQYDIRDEGYSRCVAFNRRASLLASGCSDGRVVVWDFLTRTIVKIFVGHVQPVTVVCWSKNSKRLLTASGDCNVVVWNVVTGTKVAHLRFEAPITHAALHPKNQNICIVSSHLSEVVEVNLETLERVYIPTVPLTSSSPSGASPGTPLASSSSLIESTEGLPKQSPQDSGVSLTQEGLMSENSNGSSTKPLVEVPSSSTSEVKDRSSLIEVVPVRKSEVSPVAIYSHDGATIYLGDSRGNVSLVDYETKVFQGHFRVSSSAHAGVKSMVASSDMKWLLVNSSDRCIRIIDMKKLTVHKELYDAVNRQQWKSMVFSSDGEHVLAGAAHRHEHRFYFFEVFSGRMLKNLEGPKEGVLDLVWHPTQPIIVSVSTTGTIYIWGTHIDETWSSYTPGFIELEQNEEYIEREDEFDANDDVENLPAVPGAPIRKKPKYREPDTTEDVDVVTIDPMLNGGDESDDWDIHDDLIGLGSNVIPDKYLAPIKPLTATAASAHANGISS